MTMMYPIFKQIHSGFTVVRGDLYPGGLKCCALKMLLRDAVVEQEIAYAGCYFGHSAYALGIAALHTGKRVTLFFPSPARESYIFNAVKSLNNVRCIFVEALNQDSLHTKVAEYSSEYGAFCMPVGCDFAPFRDRYTEMMRSVHAGPSEAWIAGGSGVTARCMSAAWPFTHINVVDLNVRKNPDFGESPRIWRISEQLSEVAQLPPPWPAATYYDAKAWQVIRTNACAGALIWGIA